MTPRPFFWTWAAGDCMRPLLERGPVAVRPVAPEALRAGDVVLYGPPDASSVHRLVGRSADGRWLAADDAGRLAAHEVSGGAIRGRVTGALHGRAGLLWHHACRFVFITFRAVRRCFRPDAF